MKKNISNIPSSLFGIVMSLSGLSIAWKFEELAFNYNLFMSNIFFILAVISMIVLSICYLIKINIAPENFKTEFRHPTMSNFFGTIPISFLLLSAIFFEKNYLAAVILWFVGTTLIFLIAYKSFYTWLNSSQPLTNLNPAWMIPIVGTLDVGVVGFKLEFYNISLFFTCIGILFGIIFFILIINRIIFIESIPFKLQPSFFILTAPFTVGLVSYLELMHKFDFFSYVLLNFSIFLLLVIIGKILLIKECCPFMLTWWAVGFPIAAFANATQKAYFFHQTLFYAITARISLILATITILFLLFITIYKIFKGELAKLTT